MTLQLLGAGTLGAIIGWYVYYVNRYRKGEVQFSDLTTLVGIIGGAGATQILGQQTNAPEMFGAYGIGLFVGFFGYLIVLMILVRVSDNFDSDWFLDGRRKDPAPGYSIPGETQQTVRPMVRELEAAAAVAPPAAGQTIIFNAGAAAPAAADDVVEPSSKASEIIDRCEAVWEANKSDCDAFAKAVASCFGVTLNGNANAIVQQISSEVGWTRCADGPAAKAAADQGKLVIGGRTDTPHGHVVVVVSGGLANGKYPTAYWGSLGGVGRKNTTVNYSWKAPDRDEVLYYAHDA